MKFQIFAALCLSLTVSCKAVKPVAQETDTTSPRWKIFEDKLVAHQGEKVRIDISKATNTAQLLTTSGELLAEMDVSFGLPAHPTPNGTFRVTEKLRDKRSNLYGQYVDRTTREVVVGRAWEHTGPKPAGTVYQGIAMPYWLRLTNDGVGVHVGGFPRGQPTSHGCIRCPEPPQKVFWERSRVGTPVRIHTGAHPAPSALDAAEQNKEQAGEPQA